MLEVRLLGQFNVKVDGITIQIPWRPVQSLFAYLILTPGVSHRRERLAGMFWPDSSESNARNYLRHSLWRLRQRLEQGEHRYFTADRLTVGFRHREPYWLDAAELEKQGDEADLAVSVGVYVGELLPGFYDDWVSSKRERFHTLYEQKVMRFLDLLVARRRWPEVIEWSQQWLSQGTQSEFPYRYLMQAHARLEDYPAVTATYHRCVSAMKKTFGVLPSAETTQLYERLSAPPSAHNLPLPLNNLIGRAEELEQLNRLFSGSTQELHRKKENSPSHEGVAQTTRLVTLVGPGGVGKTSLAISAAREMKRQGTFADGVWLVDFGTVDQPSRVPDVIASSIGALLGPDLSTIDALVHHLRDRQVLLLFDNCEHLVETCAAVAYRLLITCSDLSILATSRELLAVTGERAFPVNPLPIPDVSQDPHTEALRQNESVQLFCRTATAIVPAFQLSAQNAPVIAQICHRLDGLPLALELAGAEVRMLGLEEIANGLNEIFRLLTKGLRNQHGRQHTLLATFDWSYKLLGNDEKALLRQLSVFSGGATLKAIENVCPAGNLKVLEGLVDKSLVVAQARAGKVTRYRMLQTIRQYAREKLGDAGQEKQLRLRHLEYLTTEVSEVLTDHHTTVASLHELASEQDNLRTALEWAAAGNGENAERLAGAMGHLWYLQRLHHLSSSLVEPSVANERATTQVHFAAALLASAQGNHELASKHFKRSQELFELLDDVHGTIRSLLGLSRSAVALNQIDEMLSYLQALRSLVESLDCPLSAVDSSAYQRMLNLAEAFQGDE